MELALFLTPISIPTLKCKLNLVCYTITRLYMHNADDEMDVRLELDVGFQKQVLFIDKVEFVRN